MSSLRISRTYRPDNLSDFKRKLLVWGSQFKECIWLDSNSYKTKYQTYDGVLAVEAASVLKTDWPNAFSQLEKFRNETRDWVFGYLGYDLKNDVESLSSDNFDGLGFPDLYFFQPKKLIFLKEGEVEFCYLNQWKNENQIENQIEKDFQSIQNVEPLPRTPSNQLKIQPRISKKNYLEKTARFLHHLHRGDIYEANFCQEFYAENAEIAPVETFFKLNEISVPPFAAFLKLDELYTISASPERYLKRVGDKIISQPIKGTARRSKDKTEDIKLAENLKNDPKEISENTMIVDLVRNDLSRTAKRASVKVEELCGLHSFEQVHQLISTVVSEVEPGTTSTEIIKTTFPMGSMTGAPKISAMKIIEEVEETKRGLYSGAIGYFSPEDDFDFNVVIRSILYNQRKKYLSFSVGGAITAKSIPEKEYEECLVKAKAMREVLEGYWNADDAD
jgi:para-aminobenzoate synthetase component 1